MARRGINKIMHIACLQWHNMGLVMTDKYIKNTFLKAFNGSTVEIV